jgi:hypothetical protein
MERGPFSEVEFASVMSQWSQGENRKLCKISDLGVCFRMAQFPDFEGSHQQDFGFTPFNHEIWPYESIIGDIETLHFTTSAHTTSIRFLGTT